MKSPTSLRPSRWSVLVLGALLSACSVSAPPVQSPPLGFEIPTSWSAEAEPIDPWWRRFGSDELTAVVEEALSSNNDIAAAAARVETAAAEARIAGADLYPQLGGSFSGARQRTNFAAPSLPGGETGDVLRSTSNNFGVSLDVSWEIDLWGRVRAATRAAVADVQATQAEYSAARLSIAAQSIKSWLALAEAALQVELTRATVESFRASARQATDRVEAGVQPPNDMYLSRSNLASAQALLEQRRQTLDAARRQLEILLGRYPEGAIAAVATLPEVPDPPPTGLPAALVRRRPDLVVAERRLAAASERIDSAEAALYPRIALTGSGGTSTEEFEDLLSGDHVVWTIAGNLVQPIFEGGRLRARIAAAEGRGDEAVATFAQRVLDAFSEVETALHADRLLEGREEALRESAEQARRAVEVSENRYGQGVESFIVVLESQRRALDAESSAILARRQRLENRVDLHLALGGGFEDSMPSVPDAEEDWMGVSLP